MSTIWLLTKFDGRINRAKYWLVTIATLVASLALGVLLAVGVVQFADHGTVSTFLSGGSAVGVTVTVNHAPVAMRFSVDDVFLLLDPQALRQAWQILPSLDLTSPAALMALLYRLIMSPLAAWIFLATSVKRLHDRDRSGWWIVPFFVAPTIYFQFADRLGNHLGDSSANLALSLVAFILYVWGFIELLFLKGTRKSNRFGADPLLAAPTAARAGRADPRFTAATRAA